MDRPKPPLRSGSLLSSSLSRISFLSVDCTLILSLAILSESASTKLRKKRRATGPHSTLADSLSRLTLRSIRRTWMDHCLGVLVFSHTRYSSLLHGSRIVDNGALFSVRYEKNYKVVTNTAPGQNISYVLTQCGTPAPSASLFSNTTVFFQVPVKSAASIATTAVAYVEMLGRRSALKAVDTEGLVSSPCVQLGLEKGEIKGLEDKNLTLRAEQFNAVDLVFSTFGSEPGTANKTVITSEVSDPGPLNVSSFKICR